MSEIETTARPSRREEGATWAATTPLDAVLPELLGTASRWGCVGRGTATLSIGARWDSVRAALDALVAEGRATVSKERVVCDRGMYPRPRRNLLP